MGQVGSVFLYRAQHGRHLLVHGGVLHGEEGSVTLQYAPEL